MAYRYWKKIILPPKTPPKLTPKRKNNLKKLLEELTAHDKKEKYDIDANQFANDKYYRFAKWGGYIWNKRPPKQPKYRPCLADDYQRFKKNFVDEYDGEVVQDTGMTHKEFWEYFKNGKREGVELHSEEYWDSIPEEHWEWKY